MNQDSDPQHFESRILAPLAGLRHLRCGAGWWRWWGGMAALGRDASA